MAASTASTHGDAPPCPDPSVHERHHKLSEQASTAALYVTNPDRNAHTPTSSGRESVLGPDGKLSSRGAATSLKYAKATDLPSFPSHGLQPNSNSAGAAANLAKDYKMRDLWQPEMSHAGSMAALKAHKEGGKLDLWQPSASSAGNSAAALAMRNLSLSPQVDRGYTETGKNNSLLAAAKSHNQGRARSGSTPTLKAPAYPDSRNSAQNALSAATISHRASVRVAPSASQDGWSSEANQAARITHIGDHMKPEMFGERPPVEPELQEQQYNAALRASAVSMAKQMYDYKEEKRLEAEAAEAVGGAASAHRRNPPLPTQTDIKQEAIRYIHLQDAAHKLAQERLAKVDKDFQAGRYREYYGYNNHQVKQSRLSVRGRRNRANSEGARNLDDSDSDDEGHARRIRQQMSQLSTGLDTVDNKKREDDRAKLLAAAEKRVHARMQDMDEKVFQDTGKVSQAMMDDWEAKARERAEKAREEREKHPGQTHIGGGKFMSQADIEAIAAARLQSTFDEINDTAEKRRARDAEIAREKDARQTERMEEKMKSDQQKAEFRRIKDADKAAARKEKEERKAAKIAEQNAARIRKNEDKRKIREIKRDEVAAAAGGAALAEVADRTKKDNDVEPQQVAPEKRASRGSVLGRIASKLKRRDDGEKSTEATPKRESAVQTEPVAIADGAAPHEEAEEVEEDHQDHAAAGIAAVAGIGAVAGIAAAGAAEDHEVVEDVSSVSDVGSGHLHPATSAEHSGHFTDAIPSPGIMTKPNLERHISMIHTSDEESDDFGDDEDEDEELYAREPVSPLAPEEKDEFPPATATAVPVATGVVAVPTVVAASAAPEAQESAAPEPTAAPKISIESPPAPAPVVKPEPEGEPSQTKEPKKSGGFLSKLRRRRSKNEGKLPGSAAPVPAPAPAPVTKDDRIVPVTSTTAGIAAEPSHAPPIVAPTTTTSEPKVSSTLDGSESISSFHRHAQDPIDHDNVSSSGADEEDVTRGRTGRIARKLGLKGGKSRTTTTTSTTATATTETAAVEPSAASPTSNDDETFEEARDHFDEGLAPAPAFAGQAKSSSPARGTRFQEEL